MQADASIDKETREDALQDLQERIDDWKGAQISTFGELLLLGTFNVMKDSTMRAEEKEYHIFLFSRILILCKDVNANKTKNRLANTKPILSTRGKPKMNLKGRIYFTNVMSVTPSSSPGNYALQITWRGDPSVTTFIIKFKSDDTLQKWHNMIMTQRSSCMLEAKSRGISETHLMSLQGANLENPYLQDEDDDYNRLSGTTYGGTDTNGYSEFSMSRNASSTSLRSRSATGGSGGSNPHMSAGRMRVPTGEMNGLSLNTRLPVTSPQDHPGGSYFSPIDRDTPPGSTVSARSSSQSAFAGYSRGATTPVSAGMYPPESHRNTAPAMARRPDGHTSGNPYMANGRHRGQNSTGGMQPAPRMRSASSPDVHPMVQQKRSYTSSEHVPSVPPIPAHMTKQMAAPSRSQNNSPNNGPPSRGSTPAQYGLPQGPRPGLPGHGYTYDPSYASERRPGHTATLSQGRAFSPPVSSPSSDGDAYIPSQLKAKVCFDENYVSMIIASNIQFRSLADRIDAKLARFTNHSIASGSVRLRYRDEDGDFILIDSDEAVHDALLDWRESHLANSTNPQNSELLLYAHAVNGEAMVPG
jgi:cell division control protein 24